MRGLLIRFAVFTSLIYAVSAAQGPSPGQIQLAQPHSQYFSGFVAEMSPNSITVTRKSPVERKVFMMDPQTKIEGKLHANARVTVRFESTPDGDRAIRIIVRA